MRYQVSIGWMYFWKAFGRLFLEEKCECDGGGGRSLIRVNGEGFCDFCHLRIQGIKAKC